MSVNILSLPFIRTNQTLIKLKSFKLENVRFASKKSNTSTQNAGNSKPKHRTWKVNDGQHVNAGQILVTQNKTRFHPGLYVEFGRNGTLNALESGKVIVTCELAQPDWTHTWIQRNYSGRDGQTFYKKYFNVIPEPLPDRFKLISSI